MRRRSERTRGSLVCEGDEHLYLREIRTILESHPVVGPPETIDQLNGHVFIGSQRNADDMATLRRLGITHVLHCAATSASRRSPYARESGVEAFLSLPAEDHTEYDITQHFAEAFAFLDKAKRRGGRVLVHCNMGINRSGAVCAAYLMEDQRTNLLDVIRLLKAKRSVVLWNRGFRLQLIRYARSRRLLGPVPQPSSTRRSSSNDSLKAVPADRRTSRSISPAPRKGERRDSRTEEVGALTASLRRSFRSRLATSLLARHTQSAEQQQQQQQQQQEDDNKSLKSFLTIPRSRKNSFLKENKQTNSRKYGSSSNHSSDSYVGSVSDHEGDNGMNSGMRHAHSTADCVGMRSRQTVNKNVVIVRATDEEKDANLSTTRPLRLYKKAATDTQIYMRNHAAGVQPRNRVEPTITDCSHQTRMNGNAGQTYRQRDMRTTDNVTNGPPYTDPIREDRYGSVNILNRMRPGLSRRSSRTSVNT